MFSVLEEFRKKKLNYSAYSLSQYDGQQYYKYNVFEDDNNFFQSKNDAPNQWWQVSFQNPVIINKYIIKEINNWNGRIKSWIINVSINSPGLQKIQYFHKPSTLQK